MTQQFGVFADVPVAKMTQFIDGVVAALEAESVGATTIARVRNRLIWGNPDGPAAVIRMTPEEYRRAIGRLGD